MNETNFSQWQVGKQAAAWFGLAVAVLWILSFALTVAGFSYPALGTAGLAVGLFSVYRCGRLVRAFRDTVPGVTLSMSFRMVWLTMLLSALLTTMAQYIYFRWMDEGAFVQAYSSVLKMDASLEQMLSVQGVSADEVLSLMASLTAERWAMMMFLYNIILATVLAPVALIFTRQKGQNRKDINGY